jgi:hypothetical protein
LEQTLQHLCQHICVRATRAVKRTLRVNETERHKVRDSLGCHIAPVRWVLRVLGPHPRREERRHAVGQAAEEGQAIFIGVHFVDPL